MAQIGAYSWIPVNNLCYRGTRYTLNEVVPFGNMPYKMGVINLNMDTLVQVQIPDEGWEDDDSRMEHLVGVILVQQYNLNRNLAISVMVGTLCRDQFGLSCIVIAPVQFYLSKR